MMGAATYAYNPYRPDRSAWTLPAVLSDAAASQPDRMFVTVPDTDERMTYGEFFTAATRFASYLVERGAPPGDRIAILSGNNLDYLVVFAGASLAGLVPVPLNTGLPATLAEKQIKETGARWLAIDGLGEEILANVIGDETTFTEVFVLGRLGAHTTRGVEVPACRATQPVELPVVSPQDVALLMFTSGTTGVSKAVTMSHSHAHLFADLARALADMNASDTLMTAFPLFHGNALLMTWYAAAIVGAEVALYERFSASKWLDRTRESGATLTNLIAGSMDAVWAQPEREDDDHNTLRRICAFPANVDVMERFKSRFGVGDIVEAYGQTEICTPVMSPTNAVRPEGSSGLGVDEAFELMIADPDTGYPVPQGGLGELLVRPRFPDAVMRGYFGRPEATVDATRGLWYHTGDIFRQDAEGWYYFKDRLASYIRRRGENVSSQEVATAIGHLEGIAECAVLGVPSPEGSEQEVFAFVVLDESHAVDAERIWQELGSRLPYFAVPRFITFVDELPKNGSQRVDIPKLRTLADIDRANERIPTRPERTR